MIWSKLLLGVKSTHDVGRGHRAAKMITRLDHVELNCQSIVWSLTPQALFPLPHRHLSSMPSRQCRRSTCPTSRETQHYQVPASVQVANRRRYVCHHGPLPLPLPLPLPAAKPYQTRKDPRSWTKGGQQQGHPVSQNEIDPSTHNRSLQNGARCRSSQTLLKTLRSSRRRERSID